MVWEPIAVTDVHPEQGAYSHACRTAGELILISGQVPLDEDNQLVGSDAATQARQVMRNLDAVLRSAGVGPDAVVKLTAYVTDAAHATAYAAARAELFSGPPPASTVVVVHGLLSADWLIEVEAIAVRDGT